MPNAASCGLSNTHITSRTSHKISSATLYYIIVSVDVEVVCVCVSFVAHGSAPKCRRMSFILMIKWLKMGKVFRFWFMRWFSLFSTTTESLFISDHTETIWSICVFARYIFVILPKINRTVQLIYVHITENAGEYNLSFDETIQDQMVKYEHLSAFAYTNRNNCVYTSSWKAIANEMI